MTKKIRLRNYFFTPTVRSLGIRIGVSLAIVGYFWFRTLTENAFLYSLASFCIGVLLTGALAPIIFYLRDKPYLNEINELEDIYLIARIQLACRGGDTRKGVMAVSKDSLLLLSLAGEKQKLKLLKEQVKIKIGEDMRSLIFELSDKGLIKVISSESIGILKALSALEWNIDEEEENDKL